MTNLPNVWNGVVFENGTTTFHFSEEFKAELKLAIEKAFIEMLIKQKQPGGLLHE